jgi:hypothetical protein
MRKEMRKGVIAVMLIAILVFTMTATALGSTVTQTITAYYNDITIYVNNQMIEPGEVNGIEVEPFIYNGTTYLPVRVIAEALGQYVEWDVSTNSVYIEDDPDMISAVLVYDWEDLDNARNYLGKNYILMKDLDKSSPGYAMYASSAANGGKGWLPIGSSNEEPFMGSFFGNGHVISDLNVDRESSDFAGLFGVLKEGSIVNLGLVEVDIVGANYSGGLVGRAFYNAIITNCYSTGMVSGVEHVGGLTGGVSGDKINKDPKVFALISDCYSTCEVTGTDPEIGYIGGLSGAAGFGATVKDSYATGDVTGILRVGGLLGATGNSSMIMGSYATGDVVGTGNFVGGLLGGVGFKSSVSGCYATGDATGVNAVGGLIGNLTNEKTELHATVDDCFATGDVAGTAAVGGLVGRAFTNITITNTYSIGEVSGSMSVGGLVGAKDATAMAVASYWDTETSGQASSVVGEGLDTDDMMEEASYDSWDFDETWTMEEDVTYPELR